MAAAGGGAGGGAFDAGVPQARQNFAEGGRSTPQWGQRRVSATGAEVGAAAGGGGGGAEMGRVGGSGAGGGGGVTNPAFRTGIQADNPSVHTRSSALSFPSLSHCCISGSSTGPLGRPWS